MRRLLLISAFALFVMVAPGVSLWGQHGGGHGGGGGHAGGGFGGGGFGGGHAGFSGGHGGGFSGGSHVSGGMRSAPNLAGGVSRGFARGPAFSPRSSGIRAFSRPLNRPFLHDGFRGRRTRSFGFRNGCFGIPCRGFGVYSPWGYGYYDPYWYDPYWFWDSDSSEDNGYDQDVAAAAEMNRQNLEEQQMMRQEQADGDQDVYARVVPPRAIPRQAEGAPILPDTMLVFHDQHKEEVHNYAIIGQTLWNFAPQHTEKIPLSDLDLPATTKANEERGVTFRIPDGGEGQ